jgi:hypothetical protein
MFKKMFGLRIDVALIACFLTAFGITDAAGSTYYVATNGFDTNSGTLARPFNTIQKAANVAVAGDTVYVRAGTYYETVLFPNSGTSGKPIVFKNYNNEDVIVSAADKVTGWTLDTGKIYWAPVNWDMGQSRNQVFIDNEMMIEARFPNISNETGIMQVMADKNTFTNTAYSGSVKSSALNQANGFWTGATYLGHNGLGWAAQSASVTGSGDGYVNITDKSESFGGTPGTGGFWCSGCPAPWGDSAGLGYGFLTGVRNALDVEREWFLDIASNRLYFQAPGGADPNTLNVYVKRRVSVFVLAGKSNITIDGLDGLGGGIDMDGSTYCTIKNGDYKGMSHFFLFKDTRADNILGTTSDDPAAAGIYMSGQYNTLDNLTLAYSAGPMVRLDGQYHTIKNSTITDAGYAGTYGAGIFIDWHKSTNTTRGGHTITRNTITRTGRSAVHWNSDSQNQLNWGTPASVLYKGSTVTYNDMSGFLMLADDGGAVYGWSANYGSNTPTVVAYNWIHDAFSRKIVGGVYTDNFSENMTIHHNVIWGVKRAVMIYTDSKNMKIYNNTMSPSEFTVAQWVPNTGLRIVNNLSTNPVYDIAGGDVASNNMGQSTGLNFVGSGEGGLYYRIQSSSPAKNAGTQIPPITNGYIGSAPDIGAYEIGSSEWTAGRNSNVAANPPDTTINELNSYRIYPNPAKYALHIEGLNESAIVDVYSINGVLVSGQNNISDGNLNILLSSGMYMLRIKTKKQTFTRKVVMTQ